jgi:two-component system chemotaxis response regulator CheB
MSEDKDCGKLEEPSTFDNSNLLIAIGGSAGSFQQIIKIVEQIPSWMEATILVATHRSPSQTNTLRDILQDRAHVEVLQPSDEDCLECTTIYVGSSNDQVKVDGQEFDIHQDRSTLARMRRIDDLFQSVAQSAGPNAAGVILSGALDDGVKGLRAISDAGGHCFVQLPSEAIVESMPVGAIREVPSARVGTTQEILGWLMELGAERSCTDD